MGIKQLIEADIKSALLGGEKDKVTILRTVKSVILGAEIASHKREEGLADSEIIALLSKETKKRQDAADLYNSVGELGRAATELKEKQIILTYLPEQISDEELGKIIDTAITDLGQALTPQTMGKVIGFVRTQSAGKADSSRIVIAVKARVDQR